MEQVQTEQLDFTDIFRNITLIYQEPGGAAAPVCQRIISIMLLVLSLCCVVSV